MREVLNAIFDGMPVEGIAQRPADEERVHDYLELWNWDCTLTRIQTVMEPSTRCSRARRMFPYHQPIIADGGYEGPKMALLAKRTGIWRLQI